MKLTKYMKRTYIMAAAMFAAGGFLARLTAEYTPKQYHIPVPAVSAEIEEDTEPEMPETKKARTVVEDVPVPETEAVWQPSVDELNLAWFFPEGADQTDPSQSHGGEIFRILMTENGQWMSDIYSYHDISPEQMAARLSLPRSRVLGGYNPKESSHDPDNPDTWTINSFKNLRLNTTNGDGQPISVYSNVIEIMSMANQYTYYKNPEDYDLFLSYAQKLWKDSHSYSVSMSDIYYCSGCMDEDATRRELEELAEQESSELQMSRSAEGDEVNGDNEYSEGNHESGDSAATPSDGWETTSPVVVASSVKDQSGVSSAALAAGNNSDTSGASPSNLARSRSESANSAGADLQAADSGDADTQSAGADSDGTVGFGSSVSASGGSDGSDSVGAGQSGCPGHVDLIINLQIKGLSESNGLFTVDSFGNDPSNMEEGGWPGWTEEMKTQARSLSSQDWYEKYGLSISLVTMTNPLTPSEIDAYMADLPAALSDTRRELIHYALSSVGKIPYHWGGKASRPDYNGNNFGTVVPADSEGRILKGLDCSGWINWVFWSVTGTRLPYESTSGLALCGTKIGRDELQPGDIVIRTGEDAHVIMFLGWTEDGRIRCIHESSAGVNNVTVSIRDANWPYYIRILND